MVQVESRSEERDFLRRNGELFGLGIMAVLTAVDRVSDGNLNKVGEGIADFLFAVGVDENLFSQENIQAALRVRERLRGYEEMRQRPWLDEDGNWLILEQMAANHELFETTDVPDELRGAMVIPVVANIARVAYERGMEASELVRADWDEEYLGPIRDFLVGEGLWDESGNMTNKGKMLVEGPLSGYVELAYSYLPYFLHLDQVRLNPENCGFGKEIGRWYPENSYASNRLIGNLLEELTQMVGQVESAVDLGSGGGLVLSALADAGVERVYGLDISGEANKAAEGLLNGRLKTFEGDLTNREDLAAMAAEIGGVEVALLNFLGHDLIGKAETREEGLVILGEFLRNMRELFPQTKLYVTDSLFSDKETLKRDKNPGRTMFALMHAISPQYLLTQEEIRELLEKAGYRVEAEVVHVRHKPDENGAKTPYIMTFVAVPDLI